MGTTHPPVGLVGRPCRRVRAGLLRRTRGPRDLLHPSIGPGAATTDRDNGADSGAEFVLTSAWLSGHLPGETARTSTSFTIFEGTSEIQRMIIGRSITGLDVR